MEHRAADDLHVVVAHAEGPARGLPDHREGFRQEVLQALAPLHALLELGSPGLQGRIVELRDRSLQLVDPIDDGLDSLEIPLVLGAENLGQNAIEHDYS